MCMFVNRTFNRKMKSFSKASALLLVALAFAGIDFAISAGQCKTKLTVIQPNEDLAIDNKRYTMINIPGFEQNATFVECISGQLCKKGKCQQDYKDHQFLTVPAGKSTFELSELKFRFFTLPYGCKCA